MDKISKFLKSLNPKEKEAILLLMEQVKSDYRKIPGITALKGKKGFFKIRIGRYRIIFRIQKKGKSAEIIRITKRNEGTYKDL
jgi:mRNA-degrading endonuclease RelE of RelBE toxin-antitoxin system